MYIDYYGLSASPFLLTPDHRFFFQSQGHRRAISYLTYGLSQQEGFIVITGDVGAGKTTLVGQLMDTCDPSEFIIANIVTTRMSGNDIVRMVAGAFGINQDGVEKVTLLQNLQNFFADTIQNGRRCLLIVDEAQNLTPEALEELRMLSNLHIDGQAPFQNFFLGQPEFRQILAKPDMEQLRQRVISSYHLGPMSEEETKEYILHRLKSVGWSDEFQITDIAFTEIYNETGGVPRRINLLCSRLLLFGFLEELKTFDRESVEQVANDLLEERQHVLDNGEVAPITAPLPEPSSQSTVGQHTREENHQETMTRLADVLNRIQLLESKHEYHEKVIRHDLAEVVSRLNQLCNRLE